MSQQTLFGNKAADEQTTLSAASDLRLGEELDELKSKLAALSTRITKGAEYLRNGDVPIEDRIKHQRLFSNLCDQASTVVERILGLVEDSELAIMMKGSQIDLSVKAGDKEYHFVPSKTWLNDSRAEITPRDLAFLSRVHRLIGTDIKDIKFLTKQQALDVDGMFKKASGTGVIRDYPLHWLGEE